MREPLKSPLSPFSKGGLGGISEVSFQIDFLHKISRFYRLVVQSGLRKIEPAGHL
jgi:hypothetical protein